MVGEHLAQQHADTARAVQPVVQPGAGAFKRPFHAHDRSQKLGPTGTAKSPVAMR